MHRLQELVRLHRQGTSAREAARLLGMSRNTVSGYLTALRSAGLLEGAVEVLPELAELKAALPANVPPQQTSSIEAWAPRVKVLLAGGAQPRGIYDLLRTTEPAFVGSLSAVKRLCARLQRDVGPRPRDVAIPVDTAAGEVAQVDFGYVGYLFDPALQVQRKAWVFVMVLAHSRHLFAKIVFDQRAETWQQLHVEAFATFGGVPRVIVPDNLKAAVIRAAFELGDDPSLHRGYVELARHYGFKVDPAPPRDPEKKGKVEAGVKYVGNNFVATLPEGLDVDAANDRLRLWTREVAGKRVHGTTHRRPLEVFEAEERTALLPLPARPYVPVFWKQARVHTDSHVIFDKRLYSVPYRFLHRDAWVRATPDTVVVYVDDERVATHDRRGPALRSTVDDHLPAERVALRHRGEDFWTRRAGNVGGDVEELAREIFALESVLNPLRTVQAIVTLLEKYPKDRANNAAKRARHFGTRTYRGLLDMLRKGLDFEPLPPALPLPNPPSNPRFARDITRMLTPENHRDWN